MSESQIGGMSLMDSMQAYDIPVPNRSGEKVNLSVDEEEDEPFRPPHYQDLQSGLRVSSSSQKIAPDKKLRKVDSDMMISLGQKPVSRQTKDRSRDGASDTHTGRGASGQESVDAHLKASMLKDSERIPLENTKKKENTSNATSGVTHSSQTEKHHGTVINHQSSSGSRGTNFLDSKSTVWPAKAEVQKFEVLKGSPSSLNGGSGWEQGSPGLKHLPSGTIGHPPAGLGHDRLLNKHLSSAGENNPLKGIKISKDNAVNSIAIQEKISGSRSQATEHRDHHLLPASLRDSRERDPSLGSDAGSLACSVQKNLGNAAILKKVSSNLNRMSKKSSEFHKESSGRASPSIEARTHLFPAPQGVGSLQREPLSQNSQNYSMHSGASNPGSRSKSRDRGTEVIKPSVSTTGMSNPTFSHASSSFGLSASKSNNGKLKKPNTAETENPKAAGAGEGFKKKSYYNILKTSCKEHAERLFQDKTDHQKKKDPPRVNSRVLAMIKNISAAPGLTSLMANGIGTRSAKNPSSRDSSNSAKRSTHSGHAKSTKSKTSSTGSNFDPHDLKRGLKFRPEVPDRMKSASKKARNTIDLTGSKTGVLSSHPGKGLLSLAASSSGSTGFQDKFATHTLGGVLRKHTKNRNLTSESDQEDDSSLEDHLKLHRLDCLRGAESLDVQQNGKLNDILKKMHIPDQEELPVHAPHKTSLKGSEATRKEVQTMNKATLPPACDRPPSSVQKTLLSIPANTNQFSELPKGMIKSSSSGKRDDQRPLSSSGTGKTTTLVSGSSHLKTPKDPRSAHQGVIHEKPTLNSHVPGLLLNSQIEISAHSKAKTPHSLGVHKVGHQMPPSYISHGSSLKDSTPIFQQDIKKKKTVASIPESISTTANAKNLLLNAQLHTPATVPEVRGGAGSVTAKQTEPRPRSSSSKGRKQYQPTALSSIKTSLGVSGHSAAGLNIFSPNSYLITHVHQVNNFINK